MPEKKISFLLTRHGLTSELLFELDQNGFINKIHLKKAVNPRNKIYAIQNDQNLLAQIEDFLDGKIEKLPLNRLALNRLSKFQQKILYTLYNNVHRGEIISYAMLAKIAGLTNKGAARAVGYVMATNPFPLYFPCHRVIYSNHSIGGFSCGAKFKIWLLNIEGIRIKNGIVEGKEISLN